MASAYFYDQCLAAGGVMFIPETRGPITSQNGVLLSRYRAPSDPAGTINVTFSGIVPGTEIAVVNSAGELVANVESATANQVVNLSYYSSGNSLNEVTFRLVSLAYEMLDISYTLTSKDVSIPVKQRIDRNFENS